MANVAAYYAGIKDAKEKLDERFPQGYLFVTSVENLAKGTTNGCVSEMSTRLAAQQMVENTGRPATAQEIKGHRERAAESAEANARIEAARNPAALAVQKQAETVTRLVEELVAQKANATPKAS